MNSDTETGTPGGKSGSWTEAEKYQFLLKIIHNLAGDRGVKLSEIEMPGRTTKALSHAWAKIKSEAAEAAGGPITKPATTPRKKKNTNDEEGATPAKKRKTTKKVAKPEKVPVENPEETPEEVSDEVAKPEPTDEDDV